VQVYEVVVGRAPERSDAQRRSHPHNPQKGIKCSYCNQVFKTEEHCDQHKRDKHERENRQIIIRGNREEVLRAAKNVEDTKKQKLEDDQMLQDQHRIEKGRLIDKVERGLAEAQEVRDAANADKQEKMTLQEQQSRANYDRAVEELQARQARHITLASLESEIQKELRDMMLLLQSVPLEVRARYRAVSIIIGVRQLRSPCHSHPFCAHDFPGRAIFQCRDLRPAASAGSGGARAEDCQGAPLEER
jgi:hypothetical protein